jgi:hypothetical protein
MTHLYALLVVLTFDSAMPPVPSWHATRKDCEDHAPARVLHYELTSRPVAYVVCQPVRADGRR